MDISISRQVLSIHSISVIHCLNFKKRIVAYFINLSNIFVDAEAPVCIEVERSVFCMGERDEMTMAFVLMMYM